MTDPVVPQAASVQPAYVPAVQPATSPAQPVAPKRRNHVGIAAFIAGASGFLSPAIGVVGGFALIGQLPNIEGGNFFNMLFFGAIGAGVGFAFGLIGVVLGIISFAIKNAKRLWGILGLVLGFIALFNGWIPFFAFVASLFNPAVQGTPLNG